MTEALSNTDREVIQRCLRAAVDGPFFEDWEFQTLFGLERSEVRSVADRWPRLDWSDRDAQVAIHNSINNLLGYPHRLDLRKHVGIDHEGLSDVFARWRATVHEPR